MGVVEIREGYGKYKFYVCLYLFTYFFSFLPRIRCIFFSWIVPAFARPRPLENWKLYEKRTLKPKIYPSCISLTFARVRAWENWRLFEKGTLEPKFYISCIPLAFARPRPVLEETTTRPKPYPSRIPVAFARARPSVNWNVFEKRAFRPKPCPSNVLHWGITTDQLRFGLSLINTI